jgi:hypothetical protein
VCRCVCVCVCASTFFNSCRYSSREKVSD